MILEAITVLDCWICKKPCDLVGMDVDPKTGCVLVLAKCHGKQDSHLLDKKRLVIHGPIILQPFKPDENPR